MRLKKYFKKNPIQLQNKGGQAVKGDFNKIAQQLADMAELAANNTIRSTGYITATSTPVVVNGTEVSFGINYDHAIACRDAFDEKSEQRYEAEYGTKPDLLYLFNNGWDYDTNNAPWGEWRGEHVRALSSREGTQFVQKTAKMMEQAFPGLTVTVNPAYEGGEG